MASSVAHGTELVGGAVYEFHKPGPGQRMEVEVVFMHGLQLSSDALKSAYFNTWTTRDGQEVWPETWLKEKYPKARILSLAYDSSARKTLEAGNMRPCVLGESLLQQMVEANIGQHGCPVVFVCHSLGGLIVKEIVVRCHSSADDNPKYRNLLQNIRAFFFYATPHQGAGLADLLGWVRIPLFEMSLLVEYLNRNETTRGEVHDRFLKALDSRVMKKCKICVVAEGQKTKMFTMSKWVVRENSARFPGLSEFIQLGYADHITVCKPQNTQDTGYLKLTSCISEVIREHSSSVLMHLPVKPRGIDLKVDEVCGSLESTSQVSVVGLFGMGGVGKTTLSKKVYNLKASDYAKSCYLEEVKSRKVEDMQKQILRELCAENLEQHDRVATHHLDKIKECFAKERVLVVIDDVTSRESLEALQVFCAFEPGSQSKVIVTGRDRGILQNYERSGKLSIVYVDGIRDEKGSDMQLFAHYAFESVEEDVRESLRARFQDVANEIVKLCNGLPLSLEVIGVYLGMKYKRGNEEGLREWIDLWTEACDRLQTAQSLDGSANDRLWSSLRVSYDGLAPLERAMFLDFACIFADWDAGSTAKIKRIWDSASGVQNLLNKSLLKERRNEVVGEDELFMHDQLRDMGRYLLLKDEVKERPIYLWEDGKYDIPEGVSDLKGYTNAWNVPLVTGLDKLMDSRTPHYYSKLRLVHVRNCSEPSKLDDCLSECSGELRYLSLFSSGFPERGMQTLSSFKNLRVFELEMDKCDDRVELPLDLGKLANLVELRLKGCDKLRNLPSSIGKLKKLKILHVHECGLQSIPAEVGDLSELELLIFSRCDKITSGQNLRVRCADWLETLWFPFVPRTCLPPCPKLKSIIVEFQEEAKEFPHDFFNVDMPKLDFVRVVNYGKVKLHNPDGSAVEVEGRALLTVIRNPDGSIQKLIKRGKTFY